MCKLRAWATSVARSAMATDRKTVTLLVRDSLPETVSKQSKVETGEMANDAVRNNYVSSFVLSADVEHRAMSISDVCNNDT